MIMKGARVIVVVTMDGVDDDIDAGLEGGW